MLASHLDQGAVLRDTGRQAVHKPEKWTLLERQFPAINCLPPCALPPSTPKGRPGGPSSEGPLTTIAAPQRPETGRRNERMVAQSGVSGGRCCGVTVRQRSLACVGQGPARGGPQPSTARLLGATAVVLWSAYALLAVPICSSFVVLRSPWQCLTPSGRIGARRHAAVSVRPGRSILQRLLECRRGGVRSHAHVDVCLNLSGENWQGPEESDTAADPDEQEGVHVDCSRGSSSCRTKEGLGAGADADTPGALGEQFDVRCADASPTATTHMARGARRATGGQGVQRQDAFGPSGNLGQSAKDGNTLARGDQSRTRPSRVARGGWKVQRRGRGWKAGGKAGGDRHDVVEVVAGEMMADARNVEVVGRVLERVQLTSAQYNALILHLGRQRQTRLASETLRVMRGDGARVPVGVRHYNALIRAFDRARDWSNAMGCLELMRQDGLTPDIVSYNTVISALRRAPKLDYMPKILDLMADMAQRGCRPDAVSYNTALAGCHAAADWDTAMHVLDLMEEARVPADVVTYATLISLCERCGQLAHAATFRQQMLDAGVLPNVYVFNALLSVVRSEIQQAGGYRQKEALVAKSFGIVDIDMPSFGLKPDLVTINSLLGVLMEAGKWQRCVEMLAEMTERWALVPDVITYSTIISACNRARQWALVSDVSAQMQAAGVASNLITYNALISAAARQGDAGRAFALRDEMVAQGLVPNVVTYSALIAACQHGDRCVFAIMSCCVRVSLIMTQHMPHTSHHWDASYIIRTCD